jgi:hypothetical protein
MASTGSSGNASTQNPVFNGSGSVTAPIPLIPVTLVTVTAYTVVPGQSGTLFLLPSVGAVITLPTPAACGPGFTAKFQMIANNATTAWAITSTGNMCGLLINNAAGTLGGIIKTNANTASFTATANLGDQITVTCDGAKYSVTGYSGVTAGTA